MTETDALLILNAIPGLKNAEIIQLIRLCGSAQDVLAADSERLVKHTGLSLRLARKITRFEQKAFLDEEYLLCERFGVKIVSCFDSAFPRLLRHIPDCPIVLYYKGDITLEDDTCVAIVGSRISTIYGLHIAESLAAQLAEVGLTVVSGLARGVDSAAHRGSLKASGRTLAVLGCGLSQTYPPENKDLMETIALHGAVLSEFPLKAAPLRFNFPRRNRIISGLSLGIVIVEARRRSGALITSRFALEQGREVFAVPGRIDQPTAWGTNQLIKQGASVVLSVKDILAELKLPLRDSLDKGTVAGHKTQGKEKTGACIPLPQSQQMIYDILGREPLHIDDLAVRCQKSIHEMMGPLLQLELQRLVKRWPGQLFSKI